MSLDHAGLCRVAVAWLQRSQSAGGHGCHVAVSECRTGFGGEVPDAIGFRAAGVDDGCVIVECKTSRADFRADGAKPHRLQDGMGNWRYYLTLPGLICASELPAGWGLLEANARGHIKPVAGAAAMFPTRHYGNIRAALASWRQAGNPDREIALLTKLLSRVHDPESVNRALASANSEKIRLAGYANDLQLRVRQLEDQVAAFRRGEPPPQLAPRVVRCR